MGFCFGREKSNGTVEGYPVSAKFPVFYAMALRMAIMRASL
jgi:hypothetical protein